MRTDNRQFIMRLPIQFKQTMDKIRIERVKRGLDNKFQSYDRIALAINRNMQRKEHEKFLKDLIELEFKKDGDLR